MSSVKLREMKTIQREQRAMSIAEPVHPTTQRRDGASGFCGWWRLSWLVLQLPRCCAGAISAEKCQLLLLDSKCRPNSWGWNIVAYFWAQCVFPPRLCLLQTLLMPCLLLLAASPAIHAYTHAHTNAHTHAHAIKAATPLTSVRQRHCEHGTSPASSQS